jgi:uncharacterized membrane protein (UPF0127 family)
VLATICDLAPRRLSGLQLRARSVLELPRGVINKSATTVGDQLEILLAESSKLDDLKETLLNKVS